MLEIADAWTKQISGASSRQFLLSSEDAVRKVNRRVETLGDAELGLDLQEPVKKMRGVLERCWEGHQSELQILSL